MKLIRSIFLVLLLMNLLFALHLEDKSVRAIRATQAPKIDGHMNESVWEKLPTLTNFIQIHPYNGESPSKRTIVKTTYDNSAFYVMAKLFDQPDSISRELGSRDSYNRISSDLFEIQIAPYLDGMVSYFFSVSASGVQSDLVYSTEGRDKSLNAVWESATKIVSDGWVAEIKIPYSALRFPKKPVQDWGLNFYRTVKRSEEKSAWSYVDNEMDQWWTQTGRVENLKAIDPPLRLSFSPYVSGYLENYDGSRGMSYNGGMDMKLGLNESFTLDMTLIPDFGQVQSDDLVLNLSPFERRYSEKRQFFTEASELFSKGNIFYSRRIGDTPIDYYDVEDDLDSREKIINNTEKTQLINATKLSGRTQSGMGIGVFNAMTKSAYATIQDTISGKKRQYKTQGFTNYNLTVFDQALKHNSYISLVNSNMKTGNYLADVIATEFRFFDASQQYSLRGKGAYSYQEEQTDLTRGYTYEINAGKTNGALQYEYKYEVISDNYDPNDMGFLRRNNRVEHDADISYRVLTPFGIFRNFRNRLSFEYSRQYSPNKFMAAQFSYNISVMLKNQTRAWIYTEWTPKVRNNFYEPRVDGRYFKKPKAYGIFSGIRTNDNKFYSVNIDLGTFRSYNSSREQDWSKIGLGQFFKFNNRFTVGHRISRVNDINDHGYVDDENEVIYFGKRNVKSLTNTLESNYMFSEKSSIKFRLRHYWSSAKYKEFFTLKNDGYLADSDYETNADINFNAFNIDMTYNWNFAPGSELSLVWKNAIYLEDDHVVYSPFKNIKNTMAAPQMNSISLKILYYLDYLKFKNYTT